MAQVSVIVPVYNAKAYLAQCVQSILAQSFADFELLLLDDGSTDGSKELCDELAASDARVRAVHKSNGGPQSCVLRGLEIANGRYTAFADADDTMDKEMLATLVRAAKSTDAQCVECGYIQCGLGKDERFGSTAERCLNAQQIREEVLRPFLEQDGNLRVLTAFSRWNKLFCTQPLRQAAQKCAPDTVLGEDCVLLIAYLLHCEKLLVLQGEYLYCYRRTPESLTLNTSRLVPARPFLDELISLAHEENYTAAGVQVYRTHLYCMDMVAVLFAPLPRAQKKSAFAAARARVSKEEFNAFCASQGAPTRLALRVADKNLPVVTPVLYALLRCYIHGKRVV